MKIYSFMRKGIDLEEIEIDINMVPGIPTFQIIGLPDAAIRESILRIKSALRSQGFNLPRKEQVIINLKPSFEKKISLGLDLAIAAAYLFVTNQLNIEQLTNNTELQYRKFYFYGELTLAGKVQTPKDLDLIEVIPDGGSVITGNDNLSIPIAHGRINELRNLSQVEWHKPQHHQVLNAVETKKYSDYLFDDAVAKLLTVVAVGEHNLFIAGPAGSGKSTFCEVLHQLLRPATESETAKINKISRVTGQKNFGRPYISPHHTSTDVALLGGGNPPQPGEITRAHLGMLVLDEFLEFRSYVKESLREPIEKREITVVRSGTKITFPADFLLVATSNLCPCGDFVPNQPATCGQYSSFCKSYFRKLSGPLIDRYDIITFSHNWKSKNKYALDEIKKEIEKARDFAKAVRKQDGLNSRLSIAECEASMSEFTRKHLLPEDPGSRRRMLALLRVARTFADLDQALEVQSQHIAAAKAMTIQPFVELKRAWY